MIKGIIFDFMRTLYDPEKGELFDGVLPMLTDFKKEGLKLGLVSFGGNEKRRLLKDVGLTGVLDWYRVVEEKTPEVFKSFLNEFKLKPEEIIVVGDLVDQEIVVGKSLGMKTVWLKRGAFAEVWSVVEPDFVIRDIMEIKRIVKGNLSSKH